MIPISRRAAILAPLSVVALGSRGLVRQAEAQTALTVSVHHVHHFKPKNSSRHRMIVTLASTTVLDSTSTVAITLSDGDQTASLNHTKVRKDGMQITAEFLFDDSEVPQHLVAPQKSMPGAADHGPTGLRHVSAVTYTFTVNNPQNNSTGMTSAPIEEPLEMDPCS